MIRYNLTANTVYQVNIGTSSAIASSTLTSTNNTNLASGSLSNTRGENNAFGKGIGGEAGSNNNAGYSGSGYGAGGGGGPYFYGGGGGGFDPNAFYGLPVNTIQGVPVSDRGNSAGPGKPGVLFLEVTRP